MLKAVERGYVQMEIQNAAYEFHQALEGLEAVVVGVNQFTQEQGTPIPLQQIDESLERKQVERLRALRQKRDRKSWEAAIKAVEQAAGSGQNLMPHIIDAVEKYATVGEIADAMRRVFGEYKETVVI